MAAAKSLVIVESPTKVKTVSKILGSNYTVKASMGHIRDLPVSAFGVDVENNFQPQYEETNKKGKNLSDLKAAARSVDDIYLASDPDREGEAIAWHLREVLSKVNKDAHFYRVTYNQITKSAIESAFQHPGDIDMNLVNSQQARRVIDRIVGYKVSPLLWTRIERKVSAGRVQSVAERLICEREREIQSFQPKEYWNFWANFQAVDNTVALKKEDSSFLARLTAMDGASNDSFTVSDAARANEILADIRKVGSWQVSNVDKSPRKRNPSAPFITSTMQQAASSALGFSATKTMKIAQQLYEGIDIGNGSIGLITYMRTDSVAVAPEAQAATRAYVIAKFGKEYVPEKTPVYKSKGNAQEAHESIRPTDVNYEPAQLKNYLDSDQMKLYELIWRRFVASQMAPAETMQTKVDVTGKTSAKGSDGHTYVFHANATVTTFPGYLRVYDVKDDETVDEENAHNAQVLGNLVSAQDCQMLDSKNEQKFTEPKPRYTEATLIRELESNGIGRPSTYAQIVETILHRNYVVKEKGKLVPTELGFNVNDYLVQNLPDLFQVGFTADMEASLDNIGSGDVQWTAMMSDFFKKFMGWLQMAKEAGAPPVEKANALVSEIHKVTHWEKPERTTGKKAFDDRKFFASIEKKLKEDGFISGRQWEALLILALKYEVDLPNLRTLAKENDFIADLETAAVKRRESDEIRQQRIEIQKEAAKNAPAQDGLPEVFEAMENVQWAEAERRRGRIFDDRKFFDSLRTQCENGKALSEKQISALYKLVEKYQEHVFHAKNVLKLLAGKLPAESISDAEDKNAAGKKLLDALQGVAQWNEPVKRGNRTYDDKDFVQSIRHHLDSGKTLSEKQIAALRRLTDKYGVSVDEAKAATPVAKGEGAGNE